MSDKIIVFLMAFAIGSSSVSAATYVWNGSHSSDWSDPLNWDGNAAPTDGNDVTLTSAGTYLPSNQDIQDLKVVKLNLGSGYPDRKLTIKGKTLWISKQIADACTSAADTIDFTIENDIVLNAASVDFKFIGDNNRTYDSRLFLLGDVRDNGTNIPVKLYTGGSGSVYLVGPKSFRGTTYLNLGYLGFDRDAALGVQTLGSGDYAYSLNSNCGNYEAFTTPGLHYKHVTLDVSRPAYFNKGAVYVSTNTDLTCGINAGTGIFQIRQSRVAANAPVNSPSFVYLNGSSPLVQRVDLFAGVIVVQQVTNALGASSSVLKVQCGTYDFNGFDATRPLNNHTQGIAVNDYYGYEPNFINNKLDSESVIPTTVTLGYNNGQSYFGGLGNIRITGDVVDADKKYSFTHTDPGRLTLAGSLGWHNGTTFSTGEVVLDYTGNNASKLAAVATAKSLSLTGGAKLTSKGNDSAATIDYIGTQTHTDAIHGPATIEVVAGNADNTLVISNLTASKSALLCYVCRTNGTGKARVVLPNAVNDANFGGVLGGIWNNGETFAKVDANHVVCGMEDSDYNTTFVSSSNWDVPGGEVSLAGGETRGIRFNSPLGTTLTLSKQLYTPNGLGWAGSFLMTPKSGDVTIKGSIIRTDNHQNMLMLAQFNTNHTLRVESQVSCGINTGVSLLGPGKTEFVNDNNNFDGYLQLYCGAKLSFTSVANQGTASSLGTAASASSYGKIVLGNDTTLNYIGTDPAGHATDRVFALRGNSTISANGKGPLVLNGNLDNYVTNIRMNTPAVNSRLVLAGAGEGVINGRVSPGVIGMLVKEGTGTWTINGECRIYYPIEVKAGTLEFNGLTPATLKVLSGATLRSTSGCTLKRDLDLAGELVFDPASAAPITVWGKAKLAGALKLTRRPQDSVTLLTAENGIEGTFSSVPNGIKVKYAADSVTVAPVKGLAVIIL